jgi:putative heme-binding domain-containing protein
MNRELLRLLVHLNVTGIAERYIAYLQSDIEPAERLHAVLHLALLDGYTGTQRLIVLDTLEKALAEEGGASRSGYVQNITRKFAAQLTEDERREVLAQATKMPGAALAVLFQLEASPDEQTLASLRETYTLLEKEKSFAAGQLQIGVIAILGTSADDDSMEFLRGQYPNNPNMQGYLAMALAQKPEGENWPLLIDALRVIEGNAVPMVLQSLTKVDQAPELAEPYRRVIVHGLKLADNGGDQAVALLEHWTGEQHGEAAASAHGRLAAWQAWFSERFPNEPPAGLPAAQTASKWDFDELLTHLHSPAASGNAQRGAEVFARGQCAKCHRYGDEGESIGPDLTTLAKRFRKKEILESIVYPSHVISDQYRARTIITTSGKQIAGIVAKGAPGETIVLTPQGEKVVLKDDEIEETVPSKVSSMPEGLLNTLTLEEITDLFTYLNTPPGAATAERPR